MADSEVKVRVAPSAVAEYMRDVDRSVDERGAGIAIKRLAVDHATVRRPIATPPKVAPDGAEIWRVGADRIILHVHVHPAILDVVRVRPPHANWKPRTAEQAMRLASPRHGDLLGHLMRQQRERIGHVPDVLATLADVPTEVVDRLERGEGIPDTELRKISSVLDVDVLVRRRMR